MTPPATVMPMFPLGSVLLPGMVLPLHVFEDRYRRLVDDVLADGTATFGVTLIERGSEVGGGDIRAMVGCTARILEAGRTEDGRWALVTAGGTPLRVHEWLPDDPYPRALVVDRHDIGPVPDDAPERLTVIRSTLRRCAAYLSELGVHTPAEDELSEDPWLATYQAAVLAPLGPLDRQRILAEPSPRARLELVEELLDEQAVLLEGRLRLGSPDDPEPLE